MGEATDLYGALRAMAQSSDAQDIANTKAADPTAFPDAPGASVGSGIDLAWAAKNPTMPLPPGLAGMKQNLQQSALEKIGQDYVRGTPYLNGEEAPKDDNGNYVGGQPLDQATALMKMGAIKGEDPSATIGNIAFARSQGWIPTPKPQAATNAQPSSGNPIASKNPALARYGSQGDDNPNVPAPPNVGGSMPYPSLVASNGILNGTPQAATPPRQAAFTPPQSQPSGVALPSQSINAPSPTLPAATSFGLSPASMGALALSGRGNPLEMMKASSELEKNAADAASAAATAAQKTAETPSNVAKAQAETAETKSKTVTAPSGAPLSDAQKAEDKEFGPAWGTFKNQGGSDQLRVANQTIDVALNNLRTGKVTTGGPIDALSTDAEGHPGYVGSLLNRPLLATKTQVDSTIAPLLKPLFGARVTNFEAAKSMQSLGIDPLADTNTNIDKLMRLKDKLNSAALDLTDSGKYFDTHGGTLAEYPGNTSITQPNQTAPSVGAPAQQQIPAHRIYGTPERAQALQEQLAKLKSAGKGQ